MAISLIAVATPDADKVNDAIAIAKKLDLAFIPEPTPTALRAFTYVIWVTQAYIGLLNPADKKLQPFYIDFSSGALNYRRKYASLRKELLAKALGAKPGDNLAIVDATAGLGRDSFILAALGFKLTLLERSPIVFLLLQNALLRAAQMPGLKAIVERLTLVETEAVSWLEQAKTPDIIYLDPMFPDKQKSASSKKEMLILQNLLVKSSNEQELFERAITCAQKRVVVKRPRLAEALQGKEPSFSLRGNSSRFDIYLTKKSKN